MNSTETLFFNLSFSSSSWNGVSGARNGTAGSDIPFPLWNFQFVFSLIVNIIATILNSVVLFLFCKNSSVRKPFNFYLVNLCSSNLLFCSLYYYVKLINESLTARYPPLLFCAFLRYFSFVSGAAIHNSHFLIAMNRLCAVTWPESYRRSHQSRTAARRPALICLAMWIYIMVWLFPGIAVDAATRAQTQPDIQHCSTGTSNPRVFAVLSVCVLLDLPIGIVLLTYPYILYKQIVRVRIESSAPATSIDDAPAYARYAPQIRRSGEPANVNIHTSRPVIHKLHCCAGTLKPRRRHANFGTLSLLILTALGSLFPAQIFFTAIVFGTYIKEMVGLVSILFSLSFILDPIICLVTVGSFRLAFRNLWR